jgi:ubiquinone/menaquinone biosynthesis C-methylase UbiE
MFGRKFARFVIHKLLRQRLPGPSVRGPGTCLAARVLRLARRSDEDLGPPEGAIGTSAPALPSRPAAGAPSPRDLYTDERVGHWDRAASSHGRVRFWARYYRRHLESVYRFLIPPGQRVMEIGCGRGDLLAAVEPASGLGVDFSSVMIEQARARHPHLTFLRADAHHLPPVKPVDVVILSDCINDLWDVETVLRQVRSVLSPRGRVILNYFSRLWQLPLGLARWLRLINPTLPQNWLTSGDVANLLHLTDFEVVRTWGEMICPVALPGLSRLCNRFLARVWPFRFACLSNFMIGRAVGRNGPPAAEPKVSVIVPARNESGNIPALFERLPRMGRDTELIFVEGHSTDDTLHRIERAIAAHPEWRCQLVRQTGKGKGDAVRLGFTQATGDILMILDADLTVPPEDLPRFCRALTSDKGDLINGVRLVYPRERRAMRFFNLLGNKFFTVAFSWLLGQPIKDTLCGTKVLWKRDYERIAANRAYFGDFDPFGDFDLIFGAAKQGLKIVDLPIRYRERTYGATNIRRWKHGWLLLKMLLFAALRLKFV